MNWFDLGVEPAREKLSGAVGFSRREFPEIDM